MWEIVSKFISVFKSTHVEETKLLLTELKELKNEYKIKAIEQEVRIKNLEAKVIQLEELEMQCLQQQVVLVQRLRDLQEEQIVIHKWMKRNDQNKN